MSARIGLVGCASTKLARPAPARELYTSQLFRKASAFAQVTCDQWFVLSAKHGLVHPDQVLEPYDVKLGRAHRDPAKDAPPIHDWAKRVAGQLADRLVEYALAEVEIVVLAGEQYRTFMRYAAGWRFEVPMQGLGLGQQLAWLTRALDDTDDLTGTR